MKYRFLLLLLALSTIVAACSTTPSPRGTSGQFVSREVVVGGNAHAYQVFVPAQRAGGRHPPVILFLHGSGECGNDNQKQTEVGIGSYVRAHLDDFPAIVVFPQAPEGTEWNQNVDMVLAQLDAATREFDGDPDRTYLTGLSMGGYGTWDIALREPRRFAALVPICGGLVHSGRPSMNVASVENEADPYAAAALRLRSVPAWIFHGARDGLVPPEFSRRMHAALKAAGADVRLAEFPETGHNAWDPAYSQTPELWTWLFAQKLR